MPTSSRSCRPALLVMGVSASGKSTIGRGLAQCLGVDFVDGDDLHPAANVAKMSRGEALTDADRWPWLARVGAVLADGTAHPRGIVVACSALRRIYRDQIRAEAGAADLAFLFLDITHAEAKARLEARKNHFMPASLIDSQFATLERPMPEETDVVTLAETGDAATIVARAAEALSHWRSSEPRRI